MSCVIPVNRLFKHLCKVSGCADRMNRGMGDWVPFCEKHWFKLPRNMRMDIFGAYRASEPGRDEYATLVKFAAGELS